MKKTFVSLIAVLALTMATSALAGDRLANHNKDPWCSTSMATMATDSAPAIVTLDVGAWRVIEVESFVPMVAASREIVTDWYASAPERDIDNAYLRTVLDNDGVRSRLQRNIDDAIRPAHMTIRGTPTAATQRTRAVRL